VSFDDDVRDRGPADRPETDGADLARRLVGVGAELGTDELRVLLTIAERLKVGRQRYGALRTETDPRDFRKEAFEELADACVYLGAELLRGGRR